MAKKRRSSRRKQPRTQKAMGGQPDIRWISDAEAKRAGIDAGSITVKRLAAKQKFNVRLTPSQMDAIISQLKRWNNGKPAEISFLVKGEETARIRVAAYAYRGDTCCA